MENADEWGRDPAVRAMRKVFRGMEDAQGEFFSRMGIHRYDPRIRLWREKALVLFEGEISPANNSGLTVNEEIASNIYVKCLARVMKAQGMEIPDEVPR